MKTTSYIIAGLLGLGAVGAFCLGAYIGSAVKGTPVIDPAEAGGESVVRQVERFSVLDTEVKIYCDSMRIDFLEDLVINITEVASLDTPLLTMNEGWSKYLTLRESGDSLVMDFDFHGYKAGKTFTYDHDTSNPSIRLEEFIPTDITISVPKGMLKRVNPDRYTRFAFRGLEADSLEMGLLSSMSFDKCRIGGLSFSGKVKTAVLNSDYGRNSSKQEATLAFDESQIGSLVLDVPAASVDVTGEGSAIKSLVWNDTSEKDGMTAILSASNGLLGLVEWDSPKYGNVLRYKMDMKGKGRFALAD